MGYSITFVPPKEFVEETKKGTFLLKDTDKYELQTRVSLLVYCLNNIETTKHVDVTSICDHIAFALNYLYEITKSVVWNSVFNEFEKDGDITFCGWDYSHDYCESEYKEVFDYVLEELILLKNVKTPDYFDESEKYCKKVSDIKDKLEYFVDECAKIVTYDVIEKMRPYKEKYDEDGE